MITLPVTFTSGEAGFSADPLTYTQVVREGMFAVYERSRDGLVKDYEVIKIRIALKGDVSFKKITEEDTEHYPSTGTWGKKGWSFRSKGGALAKFEELKNGPAIVVEDEDEEDEVDGSSWRENEDFFNEDEDEKELREINRIEIADLIGRDFHHKDAEHLVYTIAECLEGTSVKIVWSGTQDVYYSASDVLMYIEDGTWILI